MHIITRKRIKGFVRLYPDREPSLDNKELNQLIRLLDDITDIVRDDEAHPLTNVMDVLGLLIETYETEHIPEPSQNAIEVLKHFIQEYELNEDDLPEIGNRTDVVAVLHGHRPLSSNYAKALGQRFGVSEAIFLDSAPLP